MFLKLNRISILGGLFSLALIACGVLASTDSVPADSVCWLKGTGDCTHQLGQGCTNGHAECTTQQCYVYVGATGNKKLNGGDLIICGHENCSYCRPSSVMDDCLDPGIG